MERKGFASERKASRGKFFKLLQEDAEALKYYFFFLPCHIFVPLGAL